MTFREYRRNRWAAMPEDVKAFWREQGFRAMHNIVLFWRTQYEIYKKSIN